MAPPDTTSLVAEDADPPTPRLVETPSMPVGPSSGGSELDWFLGSALPPDVLINAANEHQQAIAACMQDQQLEYEVEPLEYSDVLRLRFTDPRAFADAYGYGIFAADIERVATADELDGEDPNGTPPPENWIIARDGCEATNPYPLSGNLASPAVQNLAYGLQLERLQTDTAYLAAIERWIDCMASTEPSITTADGARHYVSARAAALPTDTQEEHTPWVHIISDDELTELIEFERSIYEADAKCGEESGRYEAERDIDRQVIDIVRSETGYKGVYLD